MSELLSPKGFEDQWRQLRGPMRVTPDLLRSTSFRAFVQRLTGRAPTPLVSRMGAPKGLGALKRNLDYISRDGALPLEGRDGERLVGRQQIHDRAEDWKLDQYAWNKQLNLAHSFVASMPPGTPAKPVFEAASRFARRAFAGTDFLIAKHEDEPHPHVHLSVRAQRDDGSQLVFRPLDFNRLREAFASALRDQGLEAEAAPRALRGVAVKSLRRRTQLMQRDFLAGRADEPRHVAIRIDEAFAEARSEIHAERPWEARIKAVQQRVRDNYLRIADGFDQMRDEESRRLAVALRRFVLEMDRPLTRRERLVEDARAFEASRSLSRGRERDEIVLER